MTPSEISNKTIIVAPLDWGMGHLTRCSVLIRQLLLAENKIVFAGTDFQCNWILCEFPSVNCEIIEGYKVTLDSEKSTYWQMIAQSAKMSKVMRFESQKAEELSQKYNADVIISDNRYAFRSKLTQNILLTHQLSPPVPLFRKAVTKRIQNWANEFDFCWIPDNNESPFCKDLNEVQLKIPLTYIGRLSRFNKITAAEKFDFCFIASGPSPQIEKFSEMVSNLLNHHHQKYVLVVPVDMGLPHQVVNPSTEKLNELICQSSKVIARAGYTTMMELSELNKLSILVPTPGQYEQEFLADQTNLSGFTFVQQKQLDQIFTSFID
ncbi:MAG: glycosyltransferase [Crocinitomicaceae bacterium]